MLADYLTVFLCVSHLHSLYLFFLQSLCFPACLVTMLFDILLYVPLVVSCIALGQKPRVCLIGCARLKNCSLSLVLQQVRNRQLIDWTNSTCPSGIRSNLVCCKVSMPRLMHGFPGWMSAAGHLGEVQHSSLRKSLLFLVFCDSRAGLGISTPLRIFLIFLLFVFIVLGTIERPCIHQAFYTVLRW